MDDSRLPASAEAKAAAVKMLNDFLSSDSPMLVKALTGGKDAEASEILKTIALKAAATMVREADEAGKAAALFEKIEAVLDKKTAKEGVTAGLLQVMGRLGGSLDKPAVQRLVVRCGSLFDGEYHDVRSAAALAAATAIKGAIAKGTISADGSPTQLLTSSLETMAKANTAAESRTAACGIGAAVGGIGAAALIEHDVMSKLNAAMDAKSKTAAYARESATLAVWQLCLTLKYKFEPYVVPMMSKLVKALVDKEKQLADAAALTTKALFEQLSSLSVKAVLPALYEGMQVVGGGGRSKIECLALASVLAKRAPRTMGPCLPDCIPLVMECLNDSNAKVQAAAEAALPVMCSCTENAEVSTTLKGVLMEALAKPDTTFACIEEVLLTTFCNPMDGTALAFMMPVVMRGIKDANYSLVKKSTTCASNLCALIKNPSDVAPFVPLLLPLLEKNLSHSSPDVRDASELAKQKLLDGAGGLIDPNKRAQALAAFIEAGIAQACGDRIPPEVVRYLGVTGAAMLEEKCGGVVRVQYFRDAVGMLADWVTSLSADYMASGLDAGGIAKLADTAVEKFKEELSDAAKAILSESGDKDFALDIQNIILAFAGRVLLRKADVRFERGHRYGLVGQNGTGKTTLLNRLAAKDINGFPQELKTWYIRHEVLCDDGVDVRAFLTQLAPAERKSKETVEGVLDRVEFPEEFKSTFVNSLSGGWKMKLSIAISILHEPELLLLDEPTNHLDTDAVEWLTNHLLKLEGVTIAVVSHDYDFIDKVCTDITHYDNGGQLGKPCKFVYYPMTFSEFQTLKPEIAAGLPRHDAPAKPPTETESETAPSGGDPSEALSEAMEKCSVGSGSTKSDSKQSTAESSGSAMSATLAKVDEMIAAGLILPMRFPDPGKPDGIRTFRKPILTMEKTSFKYPETDKYILEDVSVTLTLGSRAVIVGGNGSGKSTMLKLMIGDLEGDEGVGKHWKHHALRLSYVAQQSLHHLEEYVQDTPIHYIQERFRQGLDAEVGKLKTVQITDEDKAEMEKPGAITAIVGRAQKGKQMWYEVQKNGRVKADTQSFPQQELEMGKAYVKKLIKNFDQKQQALDSGMAIRPITAAEILAHLADFGIDSQLAHGKIRQMSGGQRQRLVICAAFWSKPHVIALDEPTNYLDNDSVAALTKALKDFKGAVLCVSENEAFVAEISNEKWAVEGGKVTTTQLRDAKAR